MITPNVDSPPLPANQAYRDRSLRHSSWIDAALLVLLVLVTAGANLYWQRENVVILGHDAANYLLTAIRYTQFFNGLSLPELFRAFTYPDYRTPALFIFTRPFLALFGAEVDSALLANVTLAAALLPLTYWLGRTVANRAAGLLAALLLAFLPMMAAMARLYYTELLLTTLVVVNFLALYHSQGFRRRGWSLAWGASLGFGLLAKWTMPMYLALPLLWYLWQNGLLAAQWQALRHPRRWHGSWRRILLAAGFGLLASAVWYWPNHTLAQDLPSGAWMAAGWFAIFALLAYGVLSPSGPLNNWWTAVLLAAAVASLWYLPHSDFMQKLLEIDQARAPAGASPLSLGNYTRYFGIFYTEHLGSLAFWAIVPLALAPWLIAWWRRSTLNSRATLLWLSLASAYVVLSVILQQNARNLAPVLPGLTILAAIALLAYPRRLAMAVGALWLLVLVVQWSVITFQPLAPLFAQAGALWVNSDYAVPPAAGSTDPGFWIEPDILATIVGQENKPGSHRTKLPKDQLDSLGVLMESWEVHRGLLRLLVEKDDLPVTIDPLTETDNRGWSDVLANRWLLVTDGDNSAVQEPGLSALRRIAAGDSLFDQLYAKARQYKLPSGDTVTLYRRGGPPQPNDFPVITIETTPIADAINSWWSKGATLVFGDHDTAIWTGIHDLVADHVLVPGGARSAQNEGPEAYSEPLDALRGTIFVVTRYHEKVFDLFQDAYLAREVRSGDAVLGVFGRPTRPLQNVPLPSPWDAVTVTALRTLPSLAPGEVLPVELDATNKTDRPLKLSLRLLDSAGQAVAQNDVAVGPGLRVGLLAPPAQPAPADSYTLAAVLYDGETGQVIADRSGQEPAVLAKVAVVAQPSK